MSKSKPTIQEKTTKLSELVAWFDSEDFTLEAALDRFKEAETLAKDIEADLAAFKNDIQLVKRNFDEQS